MEKIKLDLSDDDEPITLNINRAYAEKYDSWRRLEEIQKLKDRFGDDVSSDEESSSSEEEPSWSAAQEKDFLCTLAALKSQDPDIYSDKTFFHAQPTEQTPSSAEAQPSTSKKEQKPMYLKDYERKLVLEHGGDIDEEDSDDEEASRPPGYYEQQEMIKKEIKAILDVENDNDDDELLKIREKSEAELKKEEDEWYEWLKGEGKKEIPHSKQMKGLRDLWSDSKLDEQERFLRDYLCEKKYDVEGKNGLPSYEDIVAVEEDEQEMEREREFEQKFNFRFEEPDHDFIKQYPRTVKESVRKRDEKRKEKRDAYRERKEQEKQTKKDEIRELKTLKKKEIESKLERLKRMAGADDLPLTIDDLASDFDPSAYDKRMQELFNSQYYAETPGEEEKKPVFSDVSDDDADESNYDEFPISTAEGTRISETNGEQPKSEMFREREPSRRKRKRNSRFAEAVLSEKPLFDPNEKTFEEYFNEYYALDYEDIIGGDTVTRFRYRNVPANNFGLTCNEILGADDRQLNAWASLRKATAYQSEAEERYNVQAYAKKAQNVHKKNRIFATDFGGKKSQKLNQMDEEMTSTNAESVEQNESKRTRKKKKHSRKNEEKQTTTATVNVDAVETAVKKSRSRKKRRVSGGGGRRDEVSIPVDDSRLRAYGVNPKKFRNKLKYRKKSAA